MAKVQRRFVKFRIDTLDIQSIGVGFAEEDGYSILPVSDSKITDPFFDLSKNPVHYYPLITNNLITGFRRKELFENQVVLASEDQTIQALDPANNFIARCKVLVDVVEDGLFLKYDFNYFDAITNQENVDRLTLAKDSVYNLYITRKGDPFSIYSNFEITLEPLMTTGIKLPYTGPKEFSAYVVTKN